VSDPVPTGCGPVDDLLGGGFERGTVTQLYGPPASGKTNLALSAAARVAAGGDRALVLDTEGLSGERFRQLARGALADAESRAADAVERAAVEALAGRVVVTDAHDLAEQEAAVSDAAEFAPRVELIVLDSATGFYRLERDAGDEGETLRRVGRQVTHLLSLARRHDLAAVVTNQVFTDIDGDRPRALGGHTLDHWTGVVLRLDRFRGGNRRATLEKHRSREAGETATFRITGTGLAAAERTP
jgi:DNA repair protein RadB